MALGTWLNGSVISQLRGAAFLGLSDTAYIGAGTITDDTGGGGTMTWTYGSGLPCRIDPLSGDERITASRLSERSTHLVTLPPLTPVGQSDRFAIDNRGTYEVTAVRDATAEPLRFVEVTEVS